LQGSEGFISMGAGSDPMFRNPVDPSAANWTPTLAGDYRLRNESPYIDVGNHAAYLSAMGAANFAGEIDLAGNPRLSGTRIEPGAFESVRATAVSRINPSGGTVFVKQRGAGSMDGSSWENAYPGLADPLYLADRQRQGDTWTMTAGDTIRRIMVAEGIYRPDHKAATHTNDQNPASARSRTFQLVKGVRLYGGFPDAATSATHPDVESRFAPGCRSLACMPRTVLSGDMNGDDLPGDLATNVADNAHHVILGAKLSASDSVLVDGFTVTGGIADENKYIQIEGSRVYNNAGGGVSLLGAAVEMDRVAVTGNLATGMFGGGIAAVNLVASSVARQYSQLSLSRSSVNGNIGGGIYTESDLRLFDVLVAGNYSDMFGGVMVHPNGRTARVEIVNSTIAGNASDQYGSLTVDGSDLVLSNSIVWGNVRDLYYGQPSAGNFDFTAGNESVTMLNNIIEGGGANGAGLNIASAHLPVLSGNEDMDPMFSAYVDPRLANWTATAAGDYRLAYDSPAIDAGDDALYLSARGVGSFGAETDLAGKPRLFGTGIDRGAFEYQRARVPVKSGLAGTVYVKENGTGNGSSWENAYPGLADPLWLASLQRAGKAITAAGDTIRRIMVAEGVYAPKYEAGEKDNFGRDATARDRAFSMVAGVKVYGGFPAGATTASHPDLAARARTVPAFDNTVLSGAADSVYHVVVSADIPADGQTLLDGFTVTGGRADNAGRYVLKDGVGIASDAGGGIHDGYSSMSYVNLAVRGNSALRGGGVYCSDGAPSLTGMLVAGNEGTAGAGGICGEACFAVLTNLTVAGNRGGGISDDPNSILRIRNTIVWDNEGYSVRLANPDYIRSLVKGESSSNSVFFSGTAAGVEPHFVAPVAPAAQNWTPTTAGDYRLQNSSPFIDTGDDALYLSARRATDFSGETDLAGTPRLSGARIEIGAYEIASRAPAVARLNPVGGTLFVKRNGAGSMDGSSWENAYPGLADPLYFAFKQRRGEPWIMTAADTVRSIRVAEGVYLPEYKISGILDYYGLPTGDRDRAFQLANGVRLYGGFPDAATSVTHPSAESRFAAGCRAIDCLPRTILSGDLHGNDTAGDMFNNRDDNAYHVIVATGIAASDSVLIDGFTVTGGKANDRGWVQVDGDRLWQNSGGGIIGHNATVALERVAVLENMTDDAGIEFAGGITVSSDNMQRSSVAVSHSNVSGNIGGGLCIEGDLSMTDVLVSGNYSRDIGSVAVFSSSDTVTVAIVNSTVAGNATEIAGCMMFGTAAVRIENSILWGNMMISQWGATEKNIENLSPDVQYGLLNNIIGGYSLNGGDPALNFGPADYDTLHDNIDADPLFVAAIDPSRPAWTATVGGNYALSALSPAVNAGDNAAYLAARGAGDFVNETDLDGKPRMSGGRIDRGAYELQRTRFNPDSAYITLPVSDDTLICAGSTFTLRGWYLNRQIMAHPNVVTLDYRWEYSADSLFASPTTVQSGSFVGGVLPVACTFNPTDKTHEGYYRLSIENNSGEGQHFLAVSRRVRVRVYERHSVPDVRMFVYPSAGMTVNLSSLLDMRYPPGHTILWTAAHGSPPVLAGTETNAGTLDLTAWHPSIRTCTYGYELNFCGISRAKVYIHTGKNITRTDTIEICFDANRAMNALVNLNPILGVMSAAGTIDFPRDPTNAISANILRDAGGAVFLDVAAAYSAAADPAYHHNGDATVKQFAVRYADANRSRVVVLVIR
jgi:hypothetical protein